MGMDLVLSISEKIQKRVHKGIPWQEALKKELNSVYSAKNNETTLNFKSGRLNVFMIVGVNGSGKTTSLAKLANYFAESGEKVMIIAADTFRAGAVAQLEE